MNLPADVSRTDFNPSRVFVTMFNCVSSFIPNSFTLMSLKPDARSVWIALSTVLPVIIEPTTRRAQIEVVETLNDVRISYQLVPPDIGVEDGFFVPTEKRQHRFIAGLELQQVAEIARTWRSTRLESERILSLSARQPH
jgi:hypothetical protein